MARGGYVAYPDSIPLARPPKNFYELRIPVSHWQLRHYISNPEPDILYYASSHDIYCLNTRTRKRKHIATLPFEARCTASGYGWICMGGENDGHFAAVKLEGSGRAEVDSVLPVLGEERWRSADSNGTGGSAATGHMRRPASVRVERIGEDIVNSISIHRIQDEDAHLDDIVAVLTNNDNTVRVYSLPLGLQTAVLNLPFAMNHATISPDGQMLVAVGDLNKAYFFSREIRGEVPQIPKPHNRLTSAHIEWTLTSMVNLHVSSADATMGYFTTAWSPNGQLVAVGSEGGYITVFDVDMLCSPEFDDEDAIVAVNPSSRADYPPPHPGAVRSMMFSPDPWDLLIWAEDQGRVCIGDLRTGLKTKQIISLEPKDEALTRLAYEDLPSNGDTLGVDQHNNRAAQLSFDMVMDGMRRAGAANYATEHIEAMGQDPQSLRNQADGPVSISRYVPIEDDPQGLTAHEQRVLESLRTTRQREEARAAQRQTPRSVVYTSPELFSNGTTGTFDPGSPGLTNNSYLAGPPETTGSTRPISDILSSVQESLPQLSRTNAASPRPMLSDLTDSPASGTPAPLRITESAASSSSSALVRLSDASRLPRRRASVVNLSPPIATSYSASHAGSSARATSNNSSSATRAAEEEENPWRTIEDAMSLARGPLFEGAARASNNIPPLAADQRLTEQDLQVELAAERARARARQRERWRPRMAADYITSTTTTTTTSSTNQPPPPPIPPPPESTIVASANLRRLAAFPESYESILRRQQIRANIHGREIGTRTAGLAMSADGRVLWAACEEGIFEIEMNRKARMFLPCVDPR